ncbi:MAG: SDR family oxidoreductase [Pseudomonadota bacterium]|nr:SDR family oxidoreductase [Pseudomonadota bacterium]
MKKKRSRRILVSGGAGFLGTHLCGRLLRQGHAVIAADNFATGSPRNLLHLQDYPDFTLLPHDVTRPLCLDVEEIFNLACCASPRHYQADPVHTLKTCLEGSLNMLSLAKSCGARIFQASTSEVYGEPEIHPQREDYRGAVNTVGPRACYDEGKRCAEALFFDYRRQYAVVIKVGRIFNTYGPYMRADDGRVVSNFIVQALQDRPITIYGNGSQTRSFCYVDDLIEAMVRFMDTPESITGPMNLGNPAEVTVLELAEMIIDLTGSRTRLIHKPLPADDPSRRCPDISLARQTLSWQPAVSLEEGLRRTIAWFEQVLVDNDPPLARASGIYP